MDSITLDIKDGSKSASLRVNNAREPTKLTVKESGQHTVKLNVSDTNDSAQLGIESKNKPASLSVERVRIIHGSPYPEYEGETTVTPKAYQEQTLATHNTLVRQDIHVLEIPYYETTNLKGGYTAIIGG